MALTNFRASDMRRSKASQPSVSPKTTRKTKSRTPSSEPQATAPVFENVVTESATPSTTNVVEADPEQV